MQNKTKHTKIVLYIKYIVTLTLYLAIRCLAEKTYDVILLGIKFFTKFYKWEQIDERQLKRNLTFSLPAVSSSSISCSNLFIQRNVLSASDEIYDTCVILFIIGTNECIVKKF